MSRSFLEAEEPNPKYVHANLVSKTAMSDHYPRILLRYEGTQGKIFSDFVFLIRFHQNFIHLINPRQTFHFETGRCYSLIFLFPSGCIEHSFGKISYQMIGNGGFGILLRRFTGNFRLELGRLFFLSSESYTPITIRSNGLITGSIKSLVTYHTIDNDDDYQELLALRHLAYQKAGKISKNSPINQMGDQFDQRSKILVAKHKNKIVASLRLILNQTDDISEHEQFIKFPNHLPNRSDIIEITRVCTDPSYRGSDLLQGIFQYASQIAVSLDRHWIMGSSTPALLGLYRKIGFRSSTLEYVHDDLNHQPHVIFIAHKDDILLGRTVGPIHWNVMYRDIYYYAMENGLTRHKTSLDSIRIYYYLKLVYIIDLIKYYHQKFKLNKHAHHEDKRRVAGDFSL